MKYLYFKVKFVLSLYLKKNMENYIFMTRVSLSVSIYNV